MRRLAALIFDVDGTLAETEELHRQSFNLAFAQLGLDWSWDAALYAGLLQTTGGKERIVRYVRDFRPDEAAVLERLPQLHKAKTRSYLDLLAQGALDLRPGVRRLVGEAMSRNVKLGIATTSTPLNVKALLRSTLGDEAPAWFAISAGDVVARKKPHPDVYFEALEAMGVGPRDTVALEDSANGLRAARRAGIAVVATPSRYLTDEDFTGATSVISDLGEPDAPFAHIAGARFAEPWVTVDGLDALLDEATLALDG